MRLGDGGPRVENGQRGTITTADPEHGTLAVQLDAGRTVQLDPDQLDGLRLAYAGHVVREQGATVERGVALSQPLEDPYRDSGEQRGRERVERYRPPRPPERLPAPAIDRAPEITP